MLIRQQQPTIYDPRTAPIVAVDAGLVPVPRARLQADAIRARFAMPPSWQPEIRRELRFLDRRMTAAAVLVPLVERGGGLAVLLTERSANLGTHPGQIAFPGGQVEAADGGADHAALREAHEEVGLDARYVECVGRLPVYVTGSQFAVTPVVALVRPGFHLQANPAEVADVFEVPLAFLMNPAHHRHHRALYKGVEREWLSMPSMAPSATRGGAARERYIWGATAGMLRNLYRFLAA